MSKSKLFKTLKNNKMFYLFLVPAVLFFMLFVIYPFITGVIMSFQDYGLMGSAGFVGLENYKTVLTDPDFQAALRTTLVSAFFIVLFSVFIPLFLAILLNETIFKRFQSFVATAVYIPKLLSAVVLVGIFVNLFCAGSPISELFYSLGITETPENLMASEQYIRAIFIIIMTWSSIGYFTIMYSAALLSIDPTLYEAGAVEGTTWFQKTRYITIPGVSGMMKVITIVELMNVFQSFSLSLLLTNPTTQSQVSTLSVYTYEVGLMQFDIGMSVASATISFLILLGLSLVVRRAIRY